MASVGPQQPSHQFVPAGHHLPNRSFNRRNRLCHRPCKPFWARSPTSTSLCVGGCPPGPPITPLLRLQTGHSSRSKGDDFRANHSGLYSAMACARRPGTRTAPSAAPSPTHGTAPPPPPSPCHRPTPCSGFRVPFPLRPVHAMQKTRRLVLSICLCLHCAALHVCRRRGGDLHEASVGRAQWTDGWPAD